MKNIPLAILLSLNGGYVDTVGFLALAGLFTAHVTGNFVTLGAAVVLGTGGGLAKLLALPMFCLCVFLSRVAGIVLARNGHAVMRPLLAVKLVLLTVAFGLAIALGPFTNANGWPALTIGMVLVAAMAVQNGLHRVHLAKSPPTTLMTGTTTQIMLDLADLAVGTRDDSKAPAAARRLKMMCFSVAAFAAGCALAAGSYILSPVWCFAVPVVIAALAFGAKVETPEGD
ncbi:DUF1275 domain-containing protein [Neorhizobium lilium]|uniref:DUF1275 domain-containing protein n=1 Tax=Neorhizobium lilium TaxID=2503024 RepID=A0A3S3SBG6_9HYPH|nr:DUF1275 family protein [Neorhizobium lilium]RWX81770.1 DUF1275 domain-containing protein [Neorhizobium lilium]